MDQQPQVFIDFAQSLADDARRILKSHINQSFDTRIKPDRSFVTSLDLEIEAHLRRRILIQYPEHGILGEEQDSTRIDADWVWVLDPIDGTAPFIAGIPVYGTLIALAWKGAPVLGVMDFPATSDRWLGCKGEKTLHNGQPCKTRRGLPLHDAIQCVMNPDFFDAEETHVLQVFKPKTAWRIYGGSALSYGQLASGRMDIAIDSRLKVHDFAAFVPVLEGAGGVITDWEGQPLTLGSGPRVLAAGDPVLHAEALALVRGA
jgi:histidinol phosphatase-like enzyme (inositol monophosphatase family)